MWLLRDMGLLCLPMAPPQGPAVTFLLVIPYVDTRNFDGDFLRTQCCQVALLMNNNRCSGHIVSPFKRHSLWFSVISPTSPVPQTGVLLELSPSWGGRSPEQCVPRLLDFVSPEFCQRFCPLAVVGVGGGRRGAARLAR